MDSNITLQTKQMIDSLKAVCTNFGLGNASSEYKIITEVFLYKFLNDKFLFEAKRVEPALAKLSTADAEKQNGDWEHRVSTNLNVSFAFIEGESLMLALKDVAVSSGSACTSASLEPSFVLRALGRDDELAHSSIRFTLGRFTTEEEIDFVVAQLKEKVAKLREMSPLWEMHQEGVDLNQVKWSEH